MKSRLAALLVLSLSSAPLAAYADLPPPAGTSNEVEAERFKRRGDEMFDALRHEEAITFYTQSYALNPNPALLYNRGRSKEALGRFPEALVDLEQFSRTAPAEVRAKVPGIDKLVADVRSRVAELVVSCNVPSARIVVRERVMGNVAGETLRLAAGEARVDVTLEGYYPFTKTVDLKGGTATRIEVVLYPSRPEEGLLVVRGPLKAQVFVDDRNLGQPPVERPISAGEHRVSMRQDGYDDAGKMVIVAPKRRTEIELSPTPRAPFYAKGWFWGVTAAVVSGTVAAILVANSSASPDSGTLGQVSGPLVRF